MVYPVGSMKTHLDNLTAKLEKIRELFELDAPPPSAKKKPSIITRLAEAGEEAKAYNAQRAQNPTATTKKHDKELD